MYLFLCYFIFILDFILFWFIVIKLILMTFWRSSLFDRCSWSVKRVLFSSIDTHEVANDSSKRVRGRMTSPRRQLCWCNVFVTFAVCTRYHGVWRGGRNCRGERNQQQEADERRYRNGMAHVLQYRHDSWVLAGESLSLNCFYLTYLLNAVVCLFIVCDHLKSFDC